MENYKLVDENGNLTEVALACCCVFDKKIGKLFRKLLKENSRDHIAKFLAAYCAGVSEMEGIEVL